MVLVFLIRCLGSWIHQIHKYRTLFHFCFLLSFSFSCLDRSPPPFFPFLLSFFFFFFFLPQSWCLAFSNSLYLLIFLKPKPKPICLKLLSQINGSLSLAFFFFFGGFHCIWCCRLALVRWRAWVCRDRHGGGCGFVVIGICGGVSVMAQIRVWVNQ